MVTPLSSFTPSPPPPSQDVTPTPSPEAGLGRYSSMGSLLCILSLLVPLFTYLIARYMGIYDAIKENFMGYKFYLNMARVI